MTAKLKFKNLATIEAQKANALTAPLAQARGLP